MCVLERERDLANLIESIFSSYSMYIARLLLGVGENLTSRDCE